LNEARFFFCAGGRCRLADSVEHAKRARRSGRLWEYDFGMGSPHHSTSRPTEPPLSAGLRTTISFLLFLHLFALFVAVVSNARPVSALRRGLRRTPFVRQYLQLLNMDLGYNYQLTYATELDTDHFVEIELNWNGQTSPDADTLTLPDSSIRFPLRRNRYHNLTRTMAILMDEERMESELPAAIARGMLREHGIEAGRHRFRCRRHYLLTMADAGSVDPGDRDPFLPRRYGTAYEADIKVDGNDLILVKVAGAGETAPAADDRSTP